MQFLALVGFDVIKLFYFSLLIRPLWRWYVTPVFNIVVPSNIQTIGLVLLLGVILAKAPNLKEEISDMVQRQILGMLIATFAFIYGWVFHFFI